jgi:putative transposase
MLYHCRRDQRGLVAAALREVFSAESQDQARERIGHAIARLEPIALKVCRLLEEARGRPDRRLPVPVRTLDQAPVHETTRARQQGNRPPHRRRRDLPNDAAVIRLAGALLSEQNDEWLVQRRYLSVESMQLILSARWTEENSVEQQQEVAELNAA